MNKERYTVFNPGLARDFFEALCADREVIVKKISTSFSEKGDLEALYNIDQLLSRMSKIVELPDGSGVYKKTTAVSYSTPSGKSVENEGITMVEGEHYGYSPV